MDSEYTRRHLFRDHRPCVLKPGPDLASKTVYIPSVLSSRTL